MSLDLYAAENSERLTTLRPVQTPDPEAFDGFIKGTALATMKGFARAGSAIDLVGAPIAMAQDLLMGSGTEAQDRYFREHDEAFGSAAEYWTPRPGEVGAAADVVGGLVSTLPLVIAAPELAVASAHLGTAEELVQRGVSPEKANLVGAIQGAGLGLGIWMPILGQNGWQRILAGGAGFNLGLGIAMRGASGAVLQDTPAAEDFKAFDGKAMTLDALLGLAFGSLAHLVPSQRAQSERAWTRIRDWAQDLSPSDVDAIAVLRQAQHKNLDSAPGKLGEPRDIEAHVQRVDTALEQLARNQEVAVDELPAPKAAPDPARWSAAERRAEQLQKEGEALGKAYDLVLEQPEKPNRQTESPDVASTASGVDTGPASSSVVLPGGQKGGSETVSRAEQFAKASKELRELDANDEQLRTLIKDGSPEEAQDAKDNLAANKVAREKIETELRTEGPGGQSLPAAEPPPPRGRGGEKPPGPEAAKDPLLAEAQAIAAERPDLPIRTGEGAAGEPVISTAKEFMGAAAEDAGKIREQAKLVAIAAQCMLGMF